MTGVTGVYRDGKIELDDPPAGWAEGTAVRVEAEPGEAEIDLTGDGPEAIAAWMEWAEKFQALDRSGHDFQDLRRVLAENKAASKATWDEWCRSIDGLNP